MYDNGAFGFWAETTALAAPSTSSDTCCQAGDEANDKPCNGSAVSVAAIVIRRGATKLRA